MKEKRSTIYIEDSVPTESEVFREKTLEDIIEEQRAKLASLGKVLSCLLFIPFLTFELIRLELR